MKPFYRKTFVICLFLAVMLMIIGTSLASDSIETPDPTGLSVVTEGNTEVNDIIASDPIYVLPVAKIQCPYLEIRSTGTTVYLKDISERATERNWDFGDGVTSTEQNPVHTYLTRGTYTITLTVNNEFGTDSATETISVSGQIVPPAPPAA